jgi:hypothetical protein
VKGWPFWDIMNVFTIWYRLFKDSGVIHSLVLGGQTKMGNYLLSFGRIRGIAIIITLVEIFSCTLSRQEDKR